MNRNLPNVLSWARVCLIPAIAICMLIPVWGGLVAALAFGLAALTDWLDGLLARGWKLRTPFGEFFDPVADKLLVAATLLVLLAFGQTAIERWLLGLLAAAIILREIVVSAVREWVARAGHSEVTAVSWMGKAKTASQLIALPLLLAAVSLPGKYLDVAGAVLLAFAAVLGIISMVAYVRAAMRVLG